nr:acylphosphatase [Vibrio caribbeanicus]
MKVMKNCERFTIKGHVQGVGFRYHTYLEARKLDLVGYAKNLTDGSVEVIACGEKEPIETLATWLKSGPSHAIVISVAREQAKDEGHVDFDIL